MSRSTRRPYAAITGVSSAKDDKRLAHRGVRRAQNQALRTAGDYDNLLLPHKSECAWNNNYSWGRDGAQFLHTPPDRARSAGWYWANHPEKYEKWYQWQLKYYQSLLRK